MLLFHEISKNRINVREQMQRRAVDRSLRKRTIRTGPGPSTGEICK